MSRPRRAGRAALAVLSAGLFASVPIAAAAIAAVDDPGASDLATATATGWQARRGLDVATRSFADSQNVEGVIHRGAVTQALQATATAGIARDGAGIGVGVSAFAALKIASANGGDMVHVGKDGQTLNDTAWIYPGQYFLEGSAGGNTLRLGVQRFGNPFLESKDNRSLPPTFRGLSLVNEAVPGLVVSAGGSNAVIGRGRSSLAPLSTAYGGVPVRRLVYAGMDWTASEALTVAGFVSQATDVWNQAYLSLTRTDDWPRLGTIANLSAYATREQGRALQGAIHNTALSASLAGKVGAGTLTLAYQKIVGEETFDYLSETTGIALANAMIVDYNAPHEQSVQVRADLDGGDGLLPGLHLTVWRVQGWGADARASAHLHESPADPLHGLYWKNGVPVRGRHAETGVKLSAASRAGPHEGVKCSLIIGRHGGEHTYPDGRSAEYKLLIEAPLSIF